MSGVRDALVDAAATRISAWCASATPALVWQSTPATKPPSPN